jgi:DNA polymerase-3 subunit gamma/tau
MFDRLVSFTDSNLTITDVTLNLNVLDYETYFDLSSLIKNKDIPGILTNYNDIFSRGFDDVNFLNGLSRHLREILISKIGSSDKISDLKNELSIKYLEHSNDFLDEDLILMIQIINDSLINYQKINDKRIHIELCLMRLASIDSIKKKNP